MAFKGWKAIMKLPVQQFTDQSAIPPVGDGSNTTFYTYYKPITDSSGTITNDPNDVIVKVNGTPLDPTTPDYSVSGSEGKIDIVTPPASGVPVTVTYYTAGIVGYVTSISFSADSDAETFHALGSKFPVDVVPGTVEFSMDIERAYVDHAFLNLLEDKPEQEIIVEIDVDGDGDTELRVIGKITSYSLSIDLGDIVTASFTITGRLTTLS